MGRAVEHAGELGLEAEERERVIEIVYEAALDLVGRVEIDLNDTRNILSVFSPDRAPWPAPPGPAAA